MHLLTVDDNKSALTALRLLLSDVFEEITQASSPNQIPHIMECQSIDVVLLDMNFSAGVNNGNEGLYWLKQIREMEVNCPVVMITAFGDVELAVQAIKEGAFDFVLKPWDNHKLKATLTAAYKMAQSGKQVKALKNRETILKSAFQNKNRRMIGNSQPMMEMKKIIRKVAETDANVLILGENGTGKELVASEIHSCSKRNSEVLVNVDLGSISESLFESELFGHSKGSFTDAQYDRVGRFEVANGGSLFLDEIGNLSVGLQTKLLTALQRREIVRIGANIPIPVDIRLICATNKNLAEMISLGQFREDLFYRINTIQITVPPLRDRGEDVLLLAAYFLDKYADRYHKKVIVIDDVAANELLSYSWPGNVRELQHMMEKAVILSDGNKLLMSQLFSSNTNEINNILPNASLDDMEKAMIQQACLRFDGNLTAVANQLAISRQTLYNKIKRYGL